MITNYKEFQIEAILESLVLESKLQFSKPFTNILSSIKEDPIAKELLKLVNAGTDANFVQNYIDVSNNKEEVTFIPDRKALEILGKEDIKWITSSDVENKYFTYNKNEEGAYKNAHLFNALGFNPDQIAKWEPRSNVIGKIIAETVSTKSGKTVCWFVSDDGNQAVINKEALIAKNQSYLRVWDTSRNPFRVGRLAKSLLNTVKIQVTAKELENFVNSYKATFDILNDAFAKFDLVTGEDIAYWYNHENYFSMRSTLGSSCMADVDTNFFDIYVKNPEVCQLLILYSEGGSVQNGKYKSNKIKGRAIIWKTSQGDIFMDRIYTNNDSDVDLFKQFAERNGWWYKIRQSSDRNFSASNGKMVKEPTYVVNLTKSDFTKYPYVDTLSYLSKENKKITNLADAIGADYVMNNTNGSLDTY